MAAVDPRRPTSMRTAGRAAGARGVRHGAAVPTRDTLTPTLRAQLMAKEYELVAYAATEGNILRAVYLQPSRADAFREWTGAVFIRHASSPYSGGVFKFLITFKDGYPFEAPEARFATPVFHPLVAPDGKIDLGRWFQPLVPFRDNIALELVKGIKGIFFKVASCENPQNAEANELLRQQEMSEKKDIGPFTVRAQQCAKESRERAHSTIARFPTAIRFSDVSTEFAERVARDLGELDERREGQAKPNILKWFQENLVDLSSVM